MPKLLLYILLFWLVGLIVCVFFYYYSIKPNFDIFTGNFYNSNNKLFLRSYKIEENKYQIEYKNKFYIAKKIDNVIIFEFSKYNILKIKHIKGNKFLLYYPKIRSIYFLKKKSLKY